MKILFFLFARELEDFLKMTSLDLFSSLNKFFAAHLLTNFSRNLFRTLLGVLILNGASTQAVSSSTAPTSSVVDRSLRTATWVKTKLTLNNDIKCPPFPDPYGCQLPVKCRLWGHKSKLVQSHCRWCVFLAKLSSSRRTQRLRNLHPPRFQLVYWREQHRCVAGEFLASDTELLTDASLNSWISHCRLPTTRSKLHSARPELSETTRRVNSWLLEGKVTSPWHGGFVKPLLLRTPSIESHAA